MQLVWSGSQEFGAWLAEALTPVPVHADSAEARGRDLGECWLLEGMTPVAKGGTCAIIRVIRPDAQRTLTPPAEEAPTASPYSAGVATHLELFVVRGPLEVIQLKQALAHARSHARAQLTANALRGPLCHDLSGAASVVALVGQVLSSRAEGAGLVPKLSAAQLKLQALADELGELLPMRLDETSQPSAVSRSSLPLPAWFEAVHRGRRLELGESSLLDQLSAHHVILRAVLDALAQATRQSDILSLEAVRSERAIQVRARARRAESTPDDDTPAPCLVRRGPVSD